MRIENAINELRGPDAPERRNQEVRRRNKAGRAGDTVEISKAARAINAQGVSQADLNAVSDVRQARVEAVRQRVSEGFYDQPEVRRAIADAVLDSGLVDDVRQEADTVKEARGRMDDVPDVREEAVARAQRRIASDFYESSAVRGQVANRLADSLLG